MLTDKLKDQLPLLSTKDLVVFPYMFAPIFISMPEEIKAIETIWNSTSKKIIVTPIAQPFDSKLETFGVVCTILRYKKSPDGKNKILVQGLSRCKIQAVENNLAQYELLSTVNEEDPLKIQALVQSIKEIVNSLTEKGKIIIQELSSLFGDSTNIDKLSDLIAANITLKTSEAYELLKINHSYDRLLSLYKRLEKEFEVATIQETIQQSARSEITKLQREHFLREQIKVIRNELGELEENEFEGYKTKINDSEIPTAVKEEFLKQLKRFEKTHPESSEATIFRNYFDTVISLPWAQNFKNEPFEIQAVNESLNLDHYGLTQVKERILEYLAVQKLNPKTSSPILCFVGPPGVGKTSLGKSIAKALGREFIRISLGGIRDEAEIRGHRRTYVGSYPGKIIQAFKKAKAKNPVIMLDEIDKVGSDVHRGDPSAALLEVLDKEQNGEFMDHFLGVPFDISNALFLANANSLDSISPPLRDRLEIIELSGYSEFEKSLIAQKHILPKHIKDAGLSDLDISIHKNALSSLIRNYTRESGLRNLEKTIAAMCRKIARGFAEGLTSKTIDDQKVSPMKRITITESKLIKYLGASPFKNEYISPKSSGGVGIVNGLAYTQFGGEILPIEATLLPSSSFELKLTGQMGSVMQESAQTAWAYLQSQVKTFEINESLLHNKKIHIHLPHGAIPKEGPSAGVALACAILSCLKSLPVDPQIAMTGEITLHGTVLGVGGIKEKLLAAQREGKTTVLLPKGNEDLVTHLPWHYVKALNIIYVSNFHEVFSIIFNPLPKRQKNLKLLVTTVD